jgi:hypothetical protein
MTCGFRSAGALMALSWLTMPCALKAAIGTEGLKTGSHETSYLALATKVIVATAAHCTWPCR